jgi:tetratricopeptide (TPR) repeat protein
MKKGYLFLLFALCNLFATAQQITPDSIFHYYISHKQKMVLAYSFKTIADAYNEDNDVTKALAYYNKSLAAYQSINDKGGIAKLYFTIGKLLNTQGNRKEALSYRDKSKKINQEIADQQKTANTLNKLAYSYNTQLKTNLALTNYYQSLKLYLQINDKTGIVNSLNNIGTICIEQGNKPLGLQYYNLSQNIKEDCKKRARAIKAEMNNSDRVAYSFNSIAALYYRQKNYPMAHAYADSSLLIAKQANYPNSICRADSLQAQIDLALANLPTTTASQKANYLAESKTHQQQYTALHDSLQNLKAPTSSTANNNASISSADSKTSTNFNFIKTAGIIISVIGLVVILVYNSLQKKQK